MDYARTDIKEIKNIGLYKVVRGGRAEGYALCQACARNLRALINLVPGDEFIEQKITEIIVDKEKQTISTQPLDWGFKCEFVGGADKCLEES